MTLPSPAWSAPIVPSSARYQCADSGSQLMELMDEIVKEFLVESYENLDQLDQDLLALEEIPDDRDCLSRVFRTIHTIKGTSGFLAFEKLQQVTHVGENLLVSLRDGELRLSQEIANALLAMVDAVRGILRAIEATGCEGDGNYSVLIERLELLRTGQSANEPAGIDPEVVVRELTDATSASVVATEEQDALKVIEPEASQTKRRKPPKARKASPKTPAAKAKRPAKPKSLPAAVTPTSAEPASDVNHCLSPRLTSVEPAAESEVADRGSAVSDSSVRIDVHLLDKLMNLVGELVLARNQILQFGQTSEDPSVVAASQRLNLITSELQEGVMKTRMQPIRNAWNKLPRVVRDLAQSCGKEVQVLMDGADTELDKTILEAIRDPLTHIVRNSVDHGLETPDEREAAGKPREGTLSLRAFHEGGHVIIEIADDGAGIRLDRVRAKAIERGLVTTEQAAALSNRDAAQLILLPGFSTAAKVSNVSGRGVGMDVVKTNVERIGGALDIVSVAGEGTTLRIKIPLTLAIVPALVVTCRQERYCIPQVNLQELLRLEGDRVRNEIELIHSVPVHRLRGQLLPLLYLDEALQLRPRRTHDERQTEESANIVVLQAEDRTFGLVVDSITDTQEIVVKPLGQHLKGIREFAGTTIMGDGSVSLILDVVGLAQQGKVLNEHRDHAATNDSHSNTARSERQSWLVVDPGDGSRAAIELSTVGRLEEFPHSAIEHSGHEEVVQYRGHILPLLRLSNNYPASGSWDASGAESARKETMSVVVYQHNERAIGIVVGQIMDIVEHSLPSRNNDESIHACPANQIINGRVTRIIDLGELVGSAI